MTNYSDEHLGDLIRNDKVHRDVYTDPLIFDLEMERIWGRAWIYVGHESQVKKAGDYFATSIGTQPVFMTRHKDGKVHVMFNRCSHKGAQLVGDTCGHAQKLRCPYHGYVFDTDGSLLHIPREEGYDGTDYGKGKANANIKQVPRVDSYRGLVFASLSEEGPDLATWLDGAAASIDNLADRSPQGEIEIAGGCFRYVHDSNWKMFVENLNDAMHPMVVHQSSSGTAKRVFDDLKLDQDDVPFELEMLAPFTNDYEFFEKMGLTAWNHGHSVTGGKVSIHSAYSAIPGYTESLVEAYGEEKTKEILSVNRHNTVVYPSFTLKGVITSIRVVKPIAVDKTVIESWVFRQVGAPEELFHRSITYCNLINSHANLVGPDDQEAYHRMQKGLQVQDSNEWVSQHRHLGADKVNEDGTTNANGTSDMVFRHQFQTWKSYMTNQEGGQ
jgi:phenylpropionate dioxygenase-like ring-hydroxylating dioxygenase large terminal subunit